MRENKEFESEDKSFLNEHIIQLREQISSLEMQRNKILEEYHYNKERIFKNRMKEDDFFIRFNDFNEYKKKE